jgi:GNAT superfamily N-acetyltransferase
MSMLARRAQSVTMGKTGTRQEIMPITVRPLVAEDFPAWSVLWAGYLRFYRQRLLDEITTLTFARLCDPEQFPHGLAAESDGAMIGFAHYLLHRTSWSAAKSCYLEDLFVDASARGQGAGRALVRAVYDAADGCGASTVYWMTQEFNADGRALYDTLGHRTSFIKYER